ncbi:MAG: TatD family hydrolase [bacterium]|nr:TatD family hydrolase [bacterium]
MYYNVHCHKSNNITDVSNILNVDLCNDVQIDRDDFYSIGLHPWHLGSNSEQLLDIVEKNMQTKKNIALGEIGLDKKCTVSFADQLVIFKKQVKIANSFNKPVIIHCVKAYQEIIEYKKNSLVPWVIHGFNGTEELASQLINKNIYLSLGKTLLDKNSKSYKSFLHIPLESVFFETDIYDIDIKEIYNQAAELKNIPVTDIIKQIEINFKKVFKVDNNI